MMGKTNGTGKKFCAKVRRRHQLRAKLLPLTLAIIMLFSFSPTSAIYARGEGGAGGEGGTVVVDSFGEYPDTVQVVLGTSHADAVALLPTSIPATVISEEAKPYPEDLPVTWTSTPTYDGAVGSYRFTANAGEKTDDNWATYTVNITDSAQETTEDGAHEISAAPNTEIAALGLPQSLPASAMSEPVKHDAEAEVVWSSDDYNPELSGTYSFTAAFTQTDWIYAGDMPTAAVRVGDENSFGEEHAQGKEALAAEDAASDETTAAAMTVLATATAATAADMGVMATYGGNCGPAGSSSVTWAFDTTSGTLSILGTGPMADYSGMGPWHEYRDGNNNLYDFCSQVKRIVIGQGVTHIGNRAFTSFYSLSSVDIASSVNSIGAEAFSMCGNLASVVLPDEMNSLGSRAFSDCSALAHINIPEGIETLPSGLFQTCSRLTSMVIPASVKTIENGAFNGCGGINSLVMQGSEPPASNGGLSGVATQGTLYYPSDADEDTWFYWQEHYADNAKFWHFAQSVGADTTAPVLTGGEATRISGTRASVAFASSEAGVYYYAVVDAGATAPTLSTGGAGTPCVAGRITFELDGRTASGLYDIYLVVKDAEGNVSAPLKIYLGDYLTSVAVSPAPSSPADSSITKDGLPTTGGRWEIGVAHTLTAVPPAGYHFQAWTLVSGTGTSLSDRTSATTQVVLGANPTVLTASFAANVVTLNMRLDGTAYMKYNNNNEGDKFWLFQDGNFISADTYVPSSATETFTAVPNGSYVVYAGTSAATRKETSIRLDVAGDTVATVNYYTLSLRAQPSGAGEVTGGAPFLAGTKAQVTARANNGLSANAAFKRWTAEDASGSSGSFEDTGTNTTTQAQATYTVTGTTTLTAYFLQTGDGGGLTVTPPAQNVRQTLNLDPAKQADNQKIEVSAEAALGEDDSDGVQISVLSWFRESVNKPSLPDSLTDKDTFEARYNQADSDDKGSLGSADGFGGATSASDTAVVANKNGRYWFMVTFSSGGAETTEIAYADIKNIFTPYEVKVKHTVTAELPDEVPTDNSLDYSPITNIQGGSPGIPYDLDGKEVVADLPEGLTYDTVRIEGLAALSGTAPSYAGAYDFHIAQEAKDTPLALLMDEAFLANISCDQESGDYNRHLYTVSYEQDTSMWVTLRAFRVNTEGEALKTDEGIPGGVLFRDYQDFAAPLDASSGGSSSKQISHFEEEGGSFIPRDVLKWEEENNPDSAILTWEPVGWYISDAEIDFGSGFNPLDEAHDNQSFPNTAGNPATYHVQLSWKDFDPSDPSPLTLQGDPTTGEGADYWPLANGEKLYLVCYGDAGTARVYEEYRLFKRDETVGSGHTGDPLGKAETFDLLNPSVHSYTRTTAKSDVPGYVAVGSRIVTADAWDAVRDNTSLYNETGLDDKDLIIRTPPADPLKGMWDSVEVNIAGADLIDGTGQYGNYPHVVYYYAPDANGNGIPDCGEYVITLNYIGVKTDGSETMLKTDYLRPRLDPMNRPAEDATMIYVGLNGKMYWTSDGAVVDAEAGLDVSDISDAAQRNNVDFGDSYTRIEIENSTAVWLFRPGEDDNQVIPVEIPNEVGRALTLNFYFDYATDGSNKDLGKYITETYRSVSGAPLAGVADTTTYALLREAYEKEIPAQSGYLTVGWYEGSFGGVVPSAEQSELEALETLPAFHREDTASLAEDREELTAAVTFIYSPLSDDVDKDGLNNGDEVVRGASPFDEDSDDDGIPDGWEADNGLDPRDDSDAAEDADNDGLNNKEEYEEESDPHNPDSDGDGLPDGWEVTHELNPKDGDGINGATGDPDGDGLSNLGEFENNADPHNPDSDDDGMKDGWEVANRLEPDDGEGINGAEGDPDGDDWKNGEEYNGGERSTDPQSPELRILSFNANGGRNAPASVRLAGGSYETKLPDAGDMQRDAYVFAGWCASREEVGSEHNPVYKPGDIFTMERIDGRLYEGQGMEGSQVILYAVWSAPPHVELRAPVIESDGSVMFGGKVTHTLYAYKASFEYREVLADRSDNWIELDSVGNSDGDWPVDKVLSAEQLKKDTLYEVRLTAVNLSGDAMEVSLTQRFRVATTPGAGTGTVEGEVKNDGDPDSLINVTVSLQEGTTTIQSVRLEGIEYDRPLRYSFTGIADGWYSVVAYDGEYTITRDVYMKGGAMQVPYVPEIISFGEGKKQSLVVIESGSPNITAEFLPELFNDTTLYTAADQRSIVDRGGMVEIRLEASEADAGDKAALSFAAATDELKQVLFVDLSVFKTRFEESGRLIDNNHLRNDLSTLLRITVPTGGRWIEKVYRSHNGVTEEWERDIQNGDGEYFEQEEVQTVILHMNKFSGYAFAVGDAYTVSAEADPVVGGTVNLPLTSYFEGEQVSVTASANPGYVFRSWTVTEGGIALEHPNANPAVFSMPAQNVVLQANFVESATASQAIITASAGEGGRISPAGEVAVAHGATQTFSFIPDEGYHVSAVWVNDALVTGTFANPYTFTEVNSNQKISVAFERDTRTPDEDEAGDGGGGGGSGSGSGGGGVSGRIPRMGDPGATIGWLAILPVLTAGIAGTRLWRKQNLRRDRG